MRVCLVLGSARCVWDDYDEAVRQFKSFDVMCINDIGMHFPGFIKHWYSNDAKMLMRWSLARRPEHNQDFKLHTNNGGGICIPDSIRYWHWVHGNSAINAVKTCFSLGYEKVVVCGVPLDNTGHYFDPPWIKTNYDNNATLDDWSRYRVQCMGNVISMSGNLKRILEDGTVSC